MESTIVRPERLDFDSPSRRDYWVALEHDSTRGDHLIPLTVFVGPETKDGEGPRVPQSKDTRDLLLY